ncbi:MAG TPA: biotin transporter BioY [Candidatus Limnocylindria bacterium]|nr:biotin transporter BioY [Candidatus Limnocylindria bacterium]
MLSRAGLVLAGSALLALSARLEIPLPFSPVPVTAQTLAVLVIGAALGARLGAATVTLYLVQPLHDRVRPCER